MSGKQVSKVIKQIELGHVPYELSFGIEPVDRIDWSAIFYDDWNTPGFWYAKQPDGLLEQFPCLYSWVDEIAESRKGITPLMELDERCAEAKKNN